MYSQSAKSSISRAISIAAALVALLCFFLPWVEVGAGFLKANLSGYQLATGSGPAGASIPSWTSLLLVPASMLAVVALAGVSMLVNKSDGQASRAISMLLIAAGGVSAAAIAYLYFDLNAEFNKTVFGVLAQNLVAYTFGGGATLLGSLVIVAGGVFDLLSTGGKQRSMAAGNF